MKKRTLAISLLALTITPAFANNYPIPVPMPHDTYLFELKTGNEVIHRAEFETINNQAAIYQNWHVQHPMSDSSNSGQPITQKVKTGFEIQVKPTALNDDFIHIYFVYHDTPSLKTKDLETFSAQQGLYRFNTSITLAKDRTFCSDLMSNSKPLQLCLSRQ